MIPTLEILCRNLAGSAQKLRLRFNWAPGFARPGLVCWLLLACFVGRYSIAFAGESRQLSSGWRFHLGEVESGQAPELDDSEWQTVQIPHDWAIAGPFEPKQDGFAGKLPWEGVGWYRTELDLQLTDTQRLYLDFDGVMAFPQVYVNGQLAGTWDYGYTSFRIDATPYLHREGKNVIAVRVDTTKHGTRWYPGAGIYRKVVMNLCESVHLAHWGIGVTTPQITDHSAAVHAEVRIANHATEPVQAELICMLVDPEGERIEKKSLKVSLAAGESVHSLEFAIQAPHRWDVESPQLYQLQTQVVANSKTVDSCETSFGIREFEFTADDGFHLNGRRVQLQGVNLHHDLGPLGAAFYPRAMERQLEIMQDMGVNALRTSHNAPAPEVLEMCDRMGILVWDECFDKWDRTADRVEGQPSHQEHAQRHLSSLVLRDRNHPSVITWSVGNEIPDDREGVTPERVAMMAELVRQYDPTRPVTIGSCFPNHVDKDMHDSLDIVGWNYQHRYDNHRDQDPQQPILYSESASALSTRGYFEAVLPLYKTDYRSSRQLDSYDMHAAPWADIPDVEFDLMRRDAFVAGEFVWTGFDYLGEPTPFSRQARSSYFGIVDLCGIPKDRYWLYRSYWNPQATTVHLLPHWNWQGHEGQPLPVFVYTNGDSAELFLNGKSLGRRTKGKRPPRPKNLAAGKPVTVSSSQPEHPAEYALDGEIRTRWTADSAEPDQWLEVDLQQSTPLRCVLLDFEEAPLNYGYSLEVSADGANWETVVRQPASRRNNWESRRQCVHEFDAQGRYLRIRFHELFRNHWASIRQLQVFNSPTESDYYLPTYNYRLRWNEVPYEPGVLKVVAYQGDQAIGSAEVKTAGEPAELRLSPDRVHLSADGADLSYLLVECVDESGVPCPLADNRVTFEIDGPASLAGVGNGNPLALEPFQDESHPLFFGKAMLILQTQQGQPGPIRVRATSPGLRPAVATLHSFQ